MWREKKDFYLPPLNPDANIGTPNSKIIHIKVILLNIDDEDDDDDDDDEDNVDLEEPVQYSKDLAPNPCWELDLLLLIININNIIFLWSDICDDLDDDDDDDDDFEDGLKNLDEDEIYSSVIDPSHWKDDVIDITVSYPWFLMKRMIIFDKWFLKVTSYFIYSRTPEDI